LRLGNRFGVVADALGDEEVFGNLQREGLFRAAILVIEAGNGIQRDAARRVQGQAVHLDADFREFVGIDVQAVRLLVDADDQLLVVAVDVGLT
jgi:hypothetical protein